MSIAIIFVLARTVVRLRLQKRLLIDDAFLFVGAMCLCASVSLIWRFSKGIFAEEKAIIDPAKYDPRPILLYSPDQDQVGGVYIILNYITIYFVKLSFLFFFRIFIRQDRKMKIYWWTVLTIILATMLVSIITVVPLCQVFPLPFGTVRFPELDFGHQELKISQQNAIMVFMGVIGLGFSSIPSLACSHVSRY